MGNSAPAPSSGVARKLISPHVLVKLPQQALLFALLAGVHDRRPLDLAEMEHIERQLEITRALELKYVGTLLCRLVPTSDWRERRPASANPAAYGNDRRFLDRPISNRHRQLPSYLHSATEAGADPCSDAHNVSVRLQKPCSGTPSVGSAVLTLVARRSPAPCP